MDPSNSQTFMCEENGNDSRLGRERICSNASSDSCASDLEVDTQVPSRMDEAPSGPQISPIRPPNQRRMRRLPSAHMKADRVMHGNEGRVVYTAGRPPWYNTSGEQKTAFVIGLCGGSASGKTTVAKRIISALDVPWVSVLSMDSFYKVLSAEQHESALRNEYNFDHPDAFDCELLVETLRRLRAGKHVEVPSYNFVTHARDPESKDVYGANVVIFEGIMAFCNPAVRELMDMKVFVDTDSDVRLARRLSRDISERGRDLDGVIKQYMTFVKPAFEQFIAPTMTYADIIVPWGENHHNEVAMDLIVQHVHTQLQLRGFKLRSSLLCSSDAASAPLPSTLTVIESTPQIKGLHTFIRDRETSRDEFIFYSKRLMRLLVERSLALMPFTDITVETPQGVNYHGKSRAATKICCVSIMRAGETMESAVMEVVKDIRIGKMLIQTNPATGDPELHYLRLPRDIHEHRVLLLDATVASGAAAMMAVRVLLDHDVPQEHITLLSLIMAKAGIHNMAYAFPKLNIVTTAVDQELSDKFHILPGIGNFGDRFFGTDLND